MTLNRRQDDNFSKQVFLNQAASFFGMSKMSTKIERNRNDQKQTQIGTTQGMIQA